MVAPFSFSDFGKSGALNREGDFVLLPYSTRNPIEFAVPKLLYESSSLFGEPIQDPEVEGRGDTRRTAQLMNIWATDWIHRSYYDNGGRIYLLSDYITDTCALEESTFSFLRLLDISPSETHTLHTSNLLRRQMLVSEMRAKQSELAPYIW